MIFTDINELVTKAPRYLSGELQPSMVTIPLNSAFLRSRKDLEPLIERFDLFVNYGFANSTIKGKYSHLKNLVRFDDVADFVESDSSEYNESISKIDLAKIDTGITIGSLWGSHELFGAQLQSMINSMCFMMNSSYLIHEFYDEPDGCVEVLPDTSIKKTNPSLFSYYYINNNMLNCNLCLNNIVFEDILEQVFYRMLISKILLSSHDTKGVFLGNCYVSINGYKGEQNVNTRPISSYPVTIKPNSGVHLQICDGVLVDFKTIIQI